MTRFRTLLQLFKLFAYFSTFTIAYIYLFDTVFMLCTFSVGRCELQISVIFNIYMYVLGWSTRTSNLLFLIYICTLSVGRSLIRSFSSINIYMYALSGSTFHIPPNDLIRYIIAQIPLALCSTSSSMPYPSATHC